MYIYISYVWPLLWVHARHLSHLELRPRGEHGFHPGGSRHAGDAQGDALDAGSHVINAGSHVGEINDD